MLFIIWMLFFDSNSWLVHRELNKKKERNVMNRITSRIAYKNIIEEGKSDSQQGYIVRLLKHRFGGESTP